MATWNPSLQYSAAVIISVDGHEMQVVVVAMFIQAQMKIQKHVKF